jgi:hypothetical protein
MPRTAPAPRRAPLRGAPILALAASAAFAATLTCEARDAHARSARADDGDAEAAFERRGYEVELGAHAGYLTAPSADGLNSFGLGFGGRLGVSFSGVYIGASVIDYLGNSQGSISESSLLAGTELGYGFRIRGLGNGSITIRPQIGLGYASLMRTDTSVDVVSTASSSGGGKTTTVGNVYVEPRLVVMYANGGSFVSVSAGALVLPGLTYDSNGSVTWTSYGARAEVGLRF